MNLSTANSPFDPNSTISPGGLFGTEQPISVPVVITGVKAQTGINQIRGSAVSGSSGIGIPKQVTNLTATMGNASVGSTSKVTITFQRDPSDTNYSSIVVLVRGYQGNQTLTQIASGADSPINVILNNTGESVSLIVQAVGNAGSAPLSNSPSCGIRLPKNTSNGGYGTSTVTNLTLAQIPTNSGTPSLTGSVTSFATITSPQTINVSTEGTLDWVVPDTTGPSNTFNSPAHFFAKCGTAQSGSLAKSFWIGGENAGLGNTSTGLTVSSNQADTRGAAAASNSGYGVVSQQSDGNLAHVGYGFEIEAPASSSSSRTLNLYVVAETGPGCTGFTFEVIGSLTDESVTPVVIDTNVSPPNNGNVYLAQFVFQSKTAGTKLRVTVRLTSATGSISTADLGMVCATLF